MFPVNEEMYGLLQDPSVPIISPHLLLRQGLMALEGSF